MKDRIVLLLFVVLSGCQPSQLDSPDVYMDWVVNPSHGLRVHQVHGDIALDLQYKPLDYVLLKEKRMATDDPEFPTLKSELEGMEYYTLTLSLVNSPQPLLKEKFAEPNQYTQAINYYSFEAQRDIKFIDQVDSVGCSLYHFENTFGVAPYVQLLLGFPKPSSPIDRVVYFRDRLLGIPPTQFVIPASSIAHLTTLTAL